MSGGLTKLRIIAFKSETDKKEIKSYSVLINPEKIRTEYQVKYADSQAPGTTTPRLKFRHMPSGQISFYLIFDGTGLIATATRKMKTMSVPEQIEEFKATTIKYHGSIHKPYFLQLVWGKSLFRGYLTNLSIEYNLFKPDGTPIRAEASVTFKTSESAKEASSEANKNSPDLTHTRTIKAGDRLPSMCKNIYDGVNYYVQVAKHNQLNQLRKLKTGSTLNFPPLVN